MAPLSWDAVFDRDAIERALPKWIEGRPWAHGPRVASTKIVAALALTDLSHVRVVIATDDETKQTFALPLAVVPSSPDASTNAIATTGAAAVVDALTLPEVGEALVAATQRGGTSEDAGYTLRFTGLRSARADRWVAKVLHRLEEGESPELEVVRFLGAAGYRYVAPLAGWIDVARKDAPPATVAVIEGFVPRGGTARDHLREELHRWFDEILQMGDVDPPKLAPNDILSRALFPLPEDVAIAVGHYVRTAALLGTRIGEMHKLLARTDVEAFAPEHLDAKARDAIVADTKRAVGDAFAVLDVRAPGLSDDVGIAIAGLRAKIPAIEKRLGNLSNAPEGAVRIRIHGDLRLDRILYTGVDFLVDGFEGDRSRPLAARKAKRSPLEDVATMLRDVPRAVSAILAERPAPERKKLAPWATLFHRAATASFLGGWLRAASESTVLPAAPAATRALLDAFLVTRCVSELESENEATVALGLEGLREVLENEKKPGQMRTSRSFSPFVQSLRAVKVEPSQLAADDPAIRSFEEGTNTHAQRIFGAHLRSDGTTDVAVWAPNAIQVAFVGDFNDWSSEAGLLGRVGETGIHAGRVRGVREGQRYMFRIPGADDGPPRDKADPFAKAIERGGRHASLITRADYAWGDAKWMAARRQAKGKDRPISILEIEVDAGYRDIAPSLAARAAKLGFTHVELRFGHDAFFAPPPRYGTTEDLMFLVDTLHQDGVGVLFTWTPAEFPLEEHGLIEFDGMPTFEPDDSTRAAHPVSGMGLFEHGKPEVQSFLLSSALFWIEELHADGLRVDNVAAAVYRDDRRAPGTWSPNAKGGRESLEGVALVQRLTKTLKSTHPDVLVIADDSAAAWSNITQAADLGGLGFDRRCDASWVDDLRFHLGLPAAARKNHDVPAPSARANATITAIDEARAAADLDPIARRILLALAWAQPGKKLLLASEDGETAPTIAELNRIYQSTPALQGDTIEPLDLGGELLAYRRGDGLVVVANLGDADRKDHGLAAAAPGRWKILYATTPSWEDGAIETSSISLPARSVLFLVRE
ncbi:MAG: hypothetical protein KIT84_19545 [Labilithrix sp.]|nr:hypothetical protein [Labilithrix sp.]MCW5813231.1 hypothetical protein [Labilithrix sp.]